MSSTDDAGITDEVIIELSGPDRVVKGPVDVYVQDLADGGERIVTRHGEMLDEVPAEAVVEYEPYPGAKGGPGLPASDPEGEPE